MKKKHENIIEEIKLLTSLKEFAVEDYNNVISKFSYDGIIHYLNALFQGSKPETATADLLAVLAENLLNKKVFKEVAVKGGFGDIAFRETITNPVIIELKPLFTKHGDKFSMYKFDYRNHEKQIQKYLQDNQYVILTNLDEAFLFGREALVKYEPFTKTSFVLVLEMFAKTDSLWDSIRRLEDTTPKVDLEKEFFNNLKKWYEELQHVEFVSSLSLSKDEAIVLLLNKIIFIKTLEDYGLIPFRFLEENYFKKRNDWETKGEEKVFRKFFDELEEWFFDYYDTELFSTKIWDYIQKDEANLNSFRNKFESVLGLGVWNYTFGKGMIHYNYRQIDEDVFGKAYETFLAESRKDEGIYYTPKTITEYMAQRIVHALFKPVYENIIACIDKNDFDEAWKFFTQLQQIKIADTCSGSGSFLIKTLRNIYGYYYLLMKKTAYYEQYNESSNGELTFEELPKYVSDGRAFRKKCNFNDRRKLISSVILHHIYAVDIDERALETAKTNMWKEAVKLEPPVFNFRKLPKEANHILPNLAINFINGDALYDLNIDEAVEYILTNYRNEIIELHKVRSEYISSPSQPAVIETIKTIKQNIRKQLEQTLPLRKPVLAALEFYFLFFDEEGNALPKEQRGFHGIISNPPWEEIYPVAKEFANIGKYEMDKADFDTAFNKKLKDDAEMQRQWKAYINFYQQYTEYVYGNYSYHKLKPATSTAIRSHLNYFKLLFERDVQLLRKGGYLNILIPSSFQTDEGSFGLRQLAIIENELIELFSFENKGFAEKDKKSKTKIFPDVHPQFKFSVVFLKKEKAAEQKDFKAMFYLTNPSDLNYKTPLSYSLKMVKNFSPDNLSVLEFRSETDYNLCKKIRDEHLTIKQMELTLKREFNVTDDRQYFNVNKNGNAIIYEGKMIHQFNSKFASPKYYVDNDWAYNTLLEREVNRLKTEINTKKTVKDLLHEFSKNNYKIEKENYRFGYRDVGGATNERTLISSIIPKDVYSVNTIIHVLNNKYAFKKNSLIQTRLNESTKIYLMSLFNSLTLNYYMRNRISSHASMFIVYELPIAESPEKIKEEIIKKGFALLYNKSDKNLYEDLRESLNISKEYADNYNDTTTHNLLRAELEILIAKELYHLTKEDWQYLTSTFIYGENEVTRKELDEVIKISNELY